MMLKGASFDRSLWVGQPPPTEPLKVKVCGVELRNNGSAPS